MEVLQMWCKGPVSSPLVDQSKGQVLHRHTRGHGSGVDQILATTRLVHWEISDLVW